MIGAMSPAGLAVAAEHADIVGFAGLVQVPGAAAGTFTLASAGETAERAEEVRRLAGSRPHRRDVLLQKVVLGRHPEQTAADAVRESPELTVEGILECPFVLFAADARSAADELRRRQEVYGFDSVTTHQPNLEPLGEVIAAYRGYR